MAKNLPAHLTHAQTQELKLALFQLAGDYARKNLLDQDRVEYALGFICAHFAAHAGVLGGLYKEWIYAQRPDQPREAAPDQDTPVAPGGEVDDGG